MTLIIQNQLLSARLEQNAYSANELSDLINDELILAGQVNDGYIREFILPPELRGMPYTLNKSSDGGDLIIGLIGQEFVYFMDGNLSSIKPLQPGLNIIRK